MNRATVLSQMVEIEITRRTKFSIVVETLTRIGIVEEGSNTLYQICFLFHKQHRYFIAHYKEMLRMDAIEADLDEIDYGQRNLVVNLFESWGMIRCLDSAQARFPVADISSISILRHSEKDDWNLVPKYNIGRKPEIK